MNKSEKMQVKDLLEKYKNYNVIFCGSPGDAPFAHLPRELQGLTGSAFNKAVNNYNVAGFKAIKKTFTNINITHLITGGKKRPNKTYHGILIIYLISD